MTSAPPLIPAGERSQTRSARRTRPSGGGVLTPLWTLYVLTLRQNLRGKRWMVMGALFLLPALLALLVRRTSPDVPGVFLEFTFAFMLIPQALLPLVALLYASGMIQDEQEEQTLTYLLIRPIPKWALYLFKLLATLTTTILLTAIFTVLTYAAIYVGADARPDDLAQRCLKAICIHSLAVVTYSCLFGLISLFTSRALVVGIIYMALIEGLFANLPFGIRLITVIYYSRVIAYRAMSFIATEPQRGTQNLAADAWQFDLRSDPDLLLHPQLKTCVWVLILAGVVFAGLAAMICRGREFHVKTPEKS